MTWTTITYDPSTWPPEGRLLAMKLIGCKVCDILIDCMIRKGEGLGQYEAWMTMEDWEIHDIHVLQQ